MASLLLGLRNFFAFARLGSISCHDDELVFFFLHDDKGVRTLLSLLLRPFFTRRPRLDWSFEGKLFSSAFFSEVL